MIREPAHSGGTVLDLHQLPHPTSASSYARRALRHHTLRLTVARRPDVCEIRPVSPSHLLLVRHGESTWNRRELVQGQTPHVPLTAVGHRQAARAAELISEHEPTQVWTSDLLRARQTADHIAAAVGLVAQPDARLRERSYGLDEGRPVDQVPALRRPEVTPDGGETFGEVVTRVGSFLEERAQGPGLVVVVTHGVTIRAALSWLGLPDDLPDDLPGDLTVANGCVIDPFELVTGPRRVG